MRSWILMHLYSGDALVSLLALLWIVIALDLTGLTRRSLTVGSIARVFVLASLPLAALTGTPVPSPLLLLLVTLWISAATVGIGVTQPQRRALGVLFAFFATLIVVSETSYLRSGPPDHSGQSRNGSLAIIGDSLTSGGFGESQTWTNRLESRGYRVIDLSAPSATTESALRFQVPEIPASVDAVVLELGGNDMLDGTPRDDFETNLRQIIRAARQSAGQDVAIYLLEFPVLPGKWGWAAAQRRVSRDERVTIIPKRMLARILLVPGNTLDGLHLTDQGHERLSRSIEPWIGPPATGATDRRSAGAGSPP